MMILNGTENVKTFANNNFHSNVLSLTLQQLFGKSLSYNCFKFGVTMHKKFGEISLKTHQITDLILNYANKGRLISINEISMITDLAKKNMKSEVRSNSF